MIPYILAVVGGYLIGDSLKGKQYARGGFVSKGERVWNKMRSSERMSFLYENFTPEITPRGQELLVGRTFNFLPKNVKMKLESKYADVEYADGGEIASFEKKIKDAMKEENKWHFINEVVDGKNVQLKMFVGKKEVDVQIFRINGLGANMPKNYAGKRETLKMIMDNFQTKMEDGGGIQQAPNQEYLKWFKDWYKNKYNDIFILISLPNEISSPITEAGQTNIILDVIQKYEEGIDAKKYLEQLVNKADELGVTLHLVPNPRTEKLKSEAHKKKITKDYLISYYEKFGFKKVADDHMVREPKDISRMAKGGKIETYAVYPQRKVNIAKPAGEELYTTDYISTFRVVGTLDDAEAQAQKFVRENEAMYPFVVVKKIHPSGNPLKNKDISRVEKDKITKL